MYQLEVKYHLILDRFNPKNGWDVAVDIDAMERAKGPQHTPEKKQTVEQAESKLLDLSVRLEPHKQYGRVDIAARHPEHGLYLIEVEGDSSRQKEQAMYSALGQTLLLMSGENEITFGIAFPDHPSWERQLQKIPAYVKKSLRLKCFLVAANNVREL
jgi:hypothetical protein